MYQTASILNDRSCARTRVIRLAADNRGSITIESMFILLFYLFFFIATFSFFNAFHMKSINEKAGYTISDIISRQNAGAPVDDNYINGLNNVFDFLVGYAGNTQIRVTSVTYLGPTDKYDGEWSVGTRGLPGLSDAQVDALRNYLPTMANGDNVVLVETFLNYRIGQTDIGFGQTGRNTVFTTFVFTRPRFAPKIAYQS